MGRPRTLRPQLRRDSLGGPDLSYSVQGMQRLGIAFLVPIAALLGGPALRAQDAPTSFSRSHIPCCPLRGKWQATLILDSARLYRGTPKDSAVTGSIEFDEKHRFFPRDAGEDSLVMEFGRHQIDFRRMWGEPLAPEPATSVLGPGSKDPLKEVLAVDISRDTIAISLSPRITHGAVALLGSFEGDSLVKGTWTLRGNESQASGHFIMRRRK